MLRDRMASHSGAFLSWARRSAVALPASHEEPLSDRAQAMLGHNGHPTLSER